MEQTSGNYEKENGHRDSLHYVLIEDEQLTRIYLEQAIARLRPCFVKNGETVSISRIGNLLADTRPDFIISGAHLSDGNCMDEYRRLGCRIPKVIYTAYPDTLEGISDLNIVHSALKPVPIEEVETSIAKIEKTINSNIYKTK